MSDRSLPHAYEAERGLLGALLQYPAECLLGTRERLGDETPFYDPRNKLVARAVFALAKKGRAIDVTNVATILQRNGKEEEAGGLEYLADLLMAAPPQTAAYSDYCEAIMDAYTRRRLAAMAETALQAALAPDATASAGDMCDAAQRALDAVHGLRRAPPAPNLDAMVKTAFAEMDAQRHGHGGGVSWGVEWLDQWALLRPGQVTIIAARMKVGKTAMLVTCALRQAMAGIPVGVIELEMSAIQTTNRFLSQLSGVPFKAIDRGMKGAKKYELQNYGAAADQLSALSPQLHIFAGHSLAIEDVAAQARQWQLQYGIKCLWLDYVGLVRLPASRDMFAAHAQNSKAIKAMAQDLGLPVMALAQLNRGASQGVPQLAHIGGSDAYAADADYVMLLDRPDADSPAGQVGKREYTSESGHAYSPDELKGQMVCIGAASRNGAALLQVEPYHAPIMCIGEPPAIPLREINPESIPTAKDTF